MRKIDIRKLKPRLAEILNSAERGQSVIITRDGKPIVQISPYPHVRTRRATEAATAVKHSLRNPLPKGVTIRGLVEEGRR
jgi:prevent-host-death family protein